METKLAGAALSAKVTGAYAGGGTQHLDYDTTQEHAGQHTTSDLAFRGVLGEQRDRGLARDDPASTRAPSRPTPSRRAATCCSRREAHADAIPGLEIEADDVRCTHAAAVAQVDREQLYYLRSHGLAEEEAKRLVIEGFLAELVERMPAGETARGARPTPRAAAGGAARRRRLSGLAGRPLLVAGALPRRSRSVVVTTEASTIDHRDRVEREEVPVAEVCER